MLENKEHHAILGCVRLKLQSFELKNEGHSESQRK